MKPVLGVTDSWQTTSELGFRSYNDARIFRQKVQDYNNHFGVDGQNTYILSGSKGYRLTDDLKEIGEAISRDFRITGAKWAEIQARRNNYWQLYQKQMYGQVSMEDLEE